MMNFFNWRIVDAIGPGKPAHNLFIEGSNSVVTFTFGPALNSGL